jgi:hypothetical protein
VRGQYFLGGGGSGSSGTTAAAAVRERRRRRQFGNDGGGGSSGTTAAAAVRGTTATATIPGSDGRRCHCFCYGEPQFFFFLNSNELFRLFFLIGLSFNDLIMVCLSYVL